MIGWFNIFSNDIHVSVAYFKYFKTVCEWVNSNNI